MSQTAHAGVAGQALSARGDLGRQGRQLRALLGERREGGALPLRRGRAPRAPPHHAAGVHRRDLARLPARRPPGPALRLPRLRPVRSEARPPLQPEQAAARSLREGAATAPSAGATRTSATGSATAAEDLSFDRRNNAPGHAEVRGRRRRLHLGRRPAAAHVPWDETVALRAARAGLHDAPPGRAAADARHLRGPGGAGGDRAT